MNNSGTTSLGPLHNLHKCFDQVQILSDIITQWYLVPPAPKPVDVATSAAELSLALASKHPAMRIFALVICAALGVV